MVANFQTHDTPRNSDLVIVPLDVDAVFALRERIFPGDDRSFRVTCMRFNRAECASVASFPYALNRYELGCLAPRCDYGELLLNLDPVNGQQIVNLVEHSIATSTRKSAKQAFTNS